MGSLFSTFHALRAWAVKFDVLSWRGMHIFLLFAPGSASLWLKRVVSALLCSMARAMLAELSGVVQSLPAGTVRAQKVSEAVGGLQGKVEGRRGKPLARS